jgi:hypothetical protein
VSLKLTVVAAVNDDQVLNQNLMKSPMIATGGMPVVLERGHDSAGKAYNAGAARTDADVIIFAHQDVYFPPDWEQRLQESIERLQGSGAPWGVLGVWGVRPDGTFAGRVWCTGSNQEFTGPIAGVDEVASIDEIVIVIPRSAGLRFDERLPGFHLYATDIARQARDRGLKTYAIDAPVVHNSRTVPQLGQAYVRAYQHMQRKYRSQLPLQTCVLPVTRFGYPLRRYRAKVALRLMLGRVRLHSRVDSPIVVSHRLGYEG